MIYLTEPKDLTAGLWWARQIRADRSTGRDSWLIVEVAGGFPFLRARVVLRRYESNGWDRPKDDLGVIDDPSAWEFGPRIEVPSDKDRAEYAPRPAQEPA